MSGDAKEHVFVWLQRKVKELRHEAIRLSHLYDKASWRVMELEEAMPTNRDGDVSVPCGGCGQKLTFTREALQTLSRRFPTRW